MSQNTPQRKRLNKKQKQELYQNGPFRNISDLDSFVAFLQQEGGDHSAYCLELLQRQQTLTDEEKQASPEKHHVIPSRLGGPDEDWNLVNVSYDEHFKVHQLRYHQYQEPGDRMALNPRQNTDEKTREKKAESSRKGHATMRDRNIGFQNPAVQSELGRRSGGKKTPAREAAYEQQAADKSVYNEGFKKNLVFTYTNGETSIELETGADYFKRTGQIKSFLLDNMDDSYPTKQAIEKDQYFTSNFNKVLQALLPNPNARLCRDNYKGWSVRSQ